MEKDQIREIIKENCMDSRLTAEKMGISRQQVINLVKAGKLVPTLKLSSGYIFTLGDVQDYYESKLGKCKNCTYKHYLDGLKNIEKVMEE